VAKSPSEVVPSPELDGPASIPLDGSPVAYGSPGANGGPKLPPERGERVRVVSFEGGKARLIEGEPGLAELPALLARRDARVWIDVRSSTRPLNARLGEMLRLHPLLVEDLGERDQRAKLEQIGDLLHMVVFSLGFDDGRIYDRELDFVLGQRFLLTNHSEWWEPSTVRGIRMSLGEVLGRGLDHVLWTLVDSVIDGYFPILDQLGDEIDDLEDRVVAGADRALLERIFELKRQVIAVRRVISPEREMFNILSSREGPLISEPERLYFRDAYDHLIRLTDELDTYRELASAALETYLSTVNNNLSLIMKRLTGVTVVLAGLGALAGVFGMSEAGAVFRGQEAVGFWIVASACVLLTAVAVGVLRRFDWI
jgi:magnesium transporter